MTNLTCSQILTDKRAERLKYIVAQEAILDGAQSYSIGNRSLTRADLEFIAGRIDKLTTEIMTLQRGNKIKVQRVVPRDDV